MVEINQYYQMEDLEIWKREYNVPPREMAPVVLQSREGRGLIAGLRSLLGPWADNLEQANQAFHFQRQSGDFDRSPRLSKRLPQTTVHCSC
jgi:hypothetical protein